MNAKKTSHFLQLILTTFIVLIAFMLGRQSKIRTPEINDIVPVEQPEPNIPLFSFDWPELVNSGEFKQHPFLKSYFNAEGLLVNSSTPTFPLLSFLELDKYCAKATSFIGNSGSYDDGALYCEQANYISIAKENELVNVSPEIFFNDDTITRMELITSEHYCMTGGQYEISTKTEVVEILNNIPIEAYLPGIYHYQLRSKAANIDNCPRYESEDANYIASDLIFYHDDKNKIIFSVDYNQDTADEYGFLRIQVIDDYRTDSYLGGGYFLIRLQEYKKLLQFIFENAQNKKEI